MTLPEWAFAVTVACCAGILAWALPRALRGLRGLRRARRPLPRRTRTPAGLPRDGTPLTWGETVAWNELLCRYGPGEPAWPGSKQKGAGH